jgi:hypothetical protein
MEEAVFSGRIVVIASGRVAWDGAPSVFFDGEYQNWGFEEPPELAIYRELRSRGLVPSGTKPRVEDMLEALCP